jgi:hypothetical protein
MCRQRKEEQVSRCFCCLLCFEKVYTIVALPATAPVGAMASQIAGSHPPEQVCSRHMYIHREREREHVETFKHYMPVANGLFNRPPQASFHYRDPAIGVLVYQFFHSYRKGVGLP